MAEIEKKSKKSDNVFGINPEEIAQAGVYFGHKASRVHPKMKPYILGVRGTVHIIDPEKTAENLKTALEFIQKLISEDKVLLLVGTKIQARDLIKKIADECSLPYINQRWLGGTFTNFKTIFKRVEYFKDLEQKLIEGKLEKYTKKERGKISEEIQRLKIKFDGLRNLTQLPDAIFVIDMKKDDLAVKEARTKGVKVIGITDTNVDPTLSDYPIPGNDDAVSSIRYILEKVGEAILKVKPKAKMSKKNNE